MDLAQLARIPQVLDSLNPALVVNCAAYTKVDHAESEEVLATLINGEAVGVIADWSERRSRAFLTFSTDYVFSGEDTEPYLESSVTDPINAYGRSKLVGEELALAHGALVVRTSWVISGTHPNFVSTMVEKAATENLRVVNDQVGSPTVASDLAQASLKALDSGATGLLHLTNSGVTTWFDLARTAVELAGIDPERISPCSTDDYPTPAKRPAYSVLRSERLDSFGLDKMPEWQESLRPLVAELSSWI